MPYMSDICRKIRIPAEISQSTGHKKNYTRHPPFLELKYKNHAALMNSFSKLGRLGLGALSHAQISKEVQVLLCKNCLMLAYPCLSNHQPTRLKIQEQLTMLCRQRGKWCKSEQNQEIMTGERRKNMTSMWLPDIPLRYPIGPEQEQYKLCHDPVEEPKKGEDQHEPLHIFSP